MKIKRIISLFLLALLYVILTFLVQSIPEFQSLIQSKILPMFGISQSIFFISLIIIVFFVYFFIKTLENSKNIIDSNQIFSNQKTSRQKINKVIELSNFYGVTSKLFYTKNVIYIINKKLKKKFFPFKPILITGIGGAGKSSLAKYYYSYVLNKSKLFSSLLWVDAALGIRKAFLDETLTRNLSENQITTKYEIIINKLKNKNGRNLLIMDNVGKDLIEEMSFLPSLPNWKVIILSRYKFEKLKLPTIEVSDLIGEKELKRIFYYHYKKNKKNSFFVKKLNKEKLRRFFQLTEYHPLITELFAKAIANDKNKELTLEKLISAFENHKLQIAKKISIYSDYVRRETHVLEALIIAFKIFDEQNIFKQLTTKEIEIMQQLILMHDEIFDIEKLSGLLAKGRESEFKVNIYNLIGKSWLTEVTTKKSFSLKRFFTRRNNEEVTKFKLHKVIAEALKYQFHPRYNTIKKILEYYVSLYKENFDIIVETHLLTIFDYLLTNISSETDLFNLFEFVFDLAFSLKNENEKSSIIFFRKALAILEQLKNFNKKKYLPYEAKTLHYLGNLYLGMIKLSEAEIEYFRALEIYKELLKENLKEYLSNIATILNNLGVLHDKMNKLKNAEKEFFEALKIRKILVIKNIRTSLPDLAETLNNLANLHRKTNKFKNAEKEFFEALKIYRDLSEKNSHTYLPYVARISNNLGILHKETNKFNAAEKEFFEALKIFNGLSEMDQYQYLSDEAMTLNNLGVLHTKMNKLNNAEKEFFEALKIRRILVVENDRAYLPDLAETLNNLAILHGEMYKLNDAEKEFFEALKICKDLSEESSHGYIQYVAKTLNNLGVLHTKMNKLNNAEKEFFEALKIRRILVVENDRAYLPDLAETLTNLAALHVGINKLEVAEKEYFGALKIYKKLLKENPFRYEIYYASMLIMRTALFKQDEENLTIAKKILEKYNNVPRALFLLQTIEELEREK